jgi:hypothetical protein
MCFEFQLQASVKEAWLIVAIVVTGCSTRQYKTASIDIAFTKILTQFNGKKGSVFIKQTICNVHTISQVYSV